MRSVFCAALAALALAAAGCGGGNEYPEAVEREFMTSCLAGQGTSATRCRCYFEGLEDEFSYEELKQAEAGLLTGDQAPEEIAEKLVDVVSNCVE